jgi:predicted RNase H-like nuclease (RuvC/YqgF family)
MGGNVTSKSEFDIFNPEFCDSALFESTRSVNTHLDDLFENLKSTMSKYTDNTLTYRRELQYRHLWLERKDRIIARLTTELEEEKEKVAMLEKDNEELREAKEPT